MPLQLAQASIRCSICSLHLRQQEHDSGTRIFAAWQVAKACCNGEYVCMATSPTISQQKLHKSLEVLLVRSQRARARVLPTSREFPKGPASNHAILFRSCIRLMFHHILHWECSLLFSRNDFSMLLGCLPLPVCSIMQLSSPVFSSQCLTTSLQLARKPFIAATLTAKTGPQAGRY